MTLADEDTNSILTDNANRAIQGNVAMHATWWPTLETLQGTSPDDQILNQFARNQKMLIWSHLVAKYATNASSAMLLLNLIQVRESISGSVVPLAMFLAIYRPV